MEGSAGTPTLTDEEREGLLLCMLLAASLDPKALPEEGREIARVACEEVEFGTLTAEHFTELLSRAKEAIHHPPDAVMARLRKLLAREPARRRALELTVRVVLVDGIVRPQHQGLLAELVRQFELPTDVLRDCVLNSQRQLLRLMFLYLADQTMAPAAEEGAAESYEQIFAYLLGLPLFADVTTEQLGVMSRTARRRLEDLRSDWGLEYITSTIRQGAELMEEPGLREQAMELVARGFGSNGAGSPAREEFYRRVSTSLGYSEAESRELLRKVGSEA